MLALGLAIVLCVPTIAHCAEESLKIGVNSDYAMPLIKVKNTETSRELQSGILKELGSEIANELERKPQWMLLPKRRVAPALIAGDVDVICHLNEVWQPAIRNDVWWSQELYRSNNVIVTLKDTKTPRSIKDLHGKRVGTVLNFIYTNLDDDFKKGLIQREDGPSNESNVQKLLHHRLNYVVMSNIEFQYYKKSYPNLVDVDFGLDSIMTKCALSKKSKISLSALNRAIENIKKSGTLERIFKSYY
ncbi:ABC transporter substrate-binding protein [Bdellovibrio sp. NC01]|uniref:substrate-binding periplasmic protein n=1 Tax=Bdellovibrio sp. NC01 TaxID=2220073 RepID=UPI001FF01E72|nr:transporter substrate-binding domain-containing protein [Bdellovibrio sp. NC01]